MPGNARDCGAFDNHRLLTQYNYMKFCSLKVLAKSYLQHYCCIHDSGADTTR